MGFYHTSIFCHNNFIVAGADGPVERSVAAFEPYLERCGLRLVATYRTVTRILRYLEVRLDGPSAFTIHGSQTVPEAEFRIVGRDR
jgi:hypothetical protein